MEIGISLFSLLFFSRACRLKRHSHFNLTAQKREGGAGGWKSKRHRSIVGLKRKVMGIGPVIHGCHESGQFQIVQIQ